MTVPITRLAVQPWTNTDFGSVVASASRQSHAQCRPHDASRERRLSRLFSLFLPPPSGIIVPGETPLTNVRRIRAGVLGGPDRRGEAEMSGMPAGFREPREERDRAHGKKGASPEFGIQNWTKPKAALSYAAELFENGSLDSAAFLPGTRLTCTSASATILMVAKGEADTGMHQQTIRGAHRHNADNLCLWAQRGTPSASSSNIPSRKGVSHGC